MHRFLSFLALALAVACSSGTPAPHPTPPPPTPAVTPCADQSFALLALTQPAADSLGIQNRLVCARPSRPSTDASTTVTAATFRVWLDGALPWPSARWIEFHPSRP